MQESTDDIPDEKPMDFNGCSIITTNTNASKLVDQQGAYLLNLRHQQVVNIGYLQQI